MDELLPANSAVLFLFLYLLPGFLGVVVYGYLREGKPTENFDRVVIAFALALVSGICVHAVFQMPVVPLQPGQPNPELGIVLQSMANLDLLARSVVAAAIAATAAFLNNWDLIHKALIFLNLSNKRSNNDVWYDVFYRHKGYWVRLEFKDGRFLVGWTKFYSASGAPRELFISDAMWARPDDSGNLISMDVVGPGVYIPDLNEISSIAILN